MLDSNQRPDGYEPSALTNWANGPKSSLSRQGGSNPRPLGYEPNALASWATPRSVLISFPNQSGWQDSNLRPPGPKPGALPSWATSRISLSRAYRPTKLKKRVWIPSTSMHLAGVEPATSWFVVRRSIQLRYRCIYAGDRDRTGTIFLSQDFKSCASAYSATPA